MTKKDFIKVAKILREQKQTYDLSTCKEQQEINKTISRLTSEFCLMFKQDNPLFNENKFKEAVLK